MKHFIHLSLCLLLFSCTNDTKPTYEPLDTKNVERLGSQTVNDNFKFGFADRILVHDSILIVFDQMQECKLQIFNKETGELINSTGRRGQGPNELIQPSNVAINHSAATLSIYDYAKGALLECSLDDLTSSDPTVWLTSELPDYEVRPNSVIPAGDNVIALHGRPRFSLSKNGRVTAATDSFPTWPEQEEREESATRLFYLTRTLWDVHPDGKKIVQGTAMGCILHVLDISDSSITPESDKYFLKPVFSFIKGQIGPTAETVYGFSCLQTTDKNIYATLHGVANPTVFPSSIYIFDWEGNPIKRLDTDRQIISFAVDEPSGDIYAIALDSNNEQIIARMR